MQAATESHVGDRGKRRFFPLTFREEIVETLERMRATGRRSEIGTFLASRGVDHHLAARWTKVLRGAGVRSGPDPIEEPPRPANGDQFIALLGGGPADIHRELRTKLAPLGIHLGHHREYGRSHTGQGPIPSDVELVILLTDMLGHSAERGLITAAKRAHVPYVRATRKMSTLVPLLRSRGFVVEDARAGVVPMPAPSPVPPLHIPQPPPPPPGDRRDAPAPQAAALHPQTDPVVPDPVAIAAPVVSDEVGGSVAAFVRQVRRWLAASGIREITITRTGFLVQFEDDAG